VGPLLVIYVGSIMLAWFVGAAKGRAGAGFALGLLLSWLGVIFAFFLRPSPSLGRKPCPFCAEPILPAAKLCPHCGSELPVPPVPPIVQGGTF
jgi:hypothetical protein